jgi:hypothetical protein
MRTSVSLPDRSVTCYSTTKNTKVSSIFFPSNGNGKAVRDTAAYDEGVVEGGEDVRDAEDVLALADGGAERHVLLLGLPRLPPPGLQQQQHDALRDLKMGRGGGEAACGTYHGDGGGGGRVGFTRKDGGEVAAAKP